MSEDNRHIPRKIDSPDRIGIIVNIRGVQSSLTAISPRPDWFRAD